MNINIRVVKRKDKFIPQVSTGVLLKSTGDDLFSQLFGSVFEPKWADIIKSQSREPIVCDTMEEAISYAERYKSYYTDEIVWTDDNDEDDENEEET